MVPKLSEVFEQTDQQLPLLTRVVIGASDVVQNFWPLLLVGVALIWLGLAVGRKTRLLKRPIDEFVVRVPIFGPLVQKSLLARFAHSFANLLHAGIPIVEALHINAKTLGNEVYKERVLLAAEDLSRGIPLAESLRDSTLFPPLLVQMIAIGEQTAQLDSVSMKIAEYYEEEVDIAVQNFTKILEPVIIVAVGSSVGVIVASIMLPIIKLIDISEAL